MPILFGPKYERFQEAKDLVKLQSAFSVHSASEFSNKMNELLNDQTLFSQAAETNKNYVKNNTGATRLISAHISTYL